jgi:hypothetical protein
MLQFLSLLNIPTVLEKYWQVVCVTLFLYLFSGRAKVVPEPHWELALAKKLFAVPSSIKGTVSRDFD